MHDEHVGSEGHQADRLKVLHRVVGDAPVEARVGDEARARKQQRGAVVRRFRGGFRPDVSVGASAVFDYEGLAEALGQLLGEDAPRRVDAPTGRKRQDDAHRALGIGMFAARGTLCDRGAHGEKEGDCRERACRIHFLAPWIARQTFCGVAGMAMSRTPEPASASTMALTTAAGAGVVAPSPAALIPSGFVGERTSTISALKEGRVSALGMAYALMDPGCGF